MAVRAFEIPLKASVPQTFLVTLSGVEYRFTLQWREMMAACWLLDIADSAGNSLVAGIPLLPGENLLRQYTDKNFGGELWVITDGSPSTPPTFDNLGIASRLLYITDGTIIRTW